MNSFNYYWPYAVDEPVLHFQYFTCLGRTLSLSDGNTYFFGNVEAHKEDSSENVSLIYYFCSLEPHTHPDLPSCSRFVVCYLPDSNNIMTL